MTNVKALEIWTAQTFCGVGILLSVISFLLHRSRARLFPIYNTLGAATDAALA